MTKTSSNRAQTIVLVEDETELATEIKAELETRGHLVRPASISEAADAARKVKEHRFHPPLDIVDGAARVCITGRCKSELDHAKSVLRTCISAACGKTP